MGRDPIAAAPNDVIDPSTELPYATIMGVKEPIGVVDLITPRDWPMNQIVCEARSELLLRVLAS